MKIQNRQTYRYFKNELEELLKAGFSREQAFIILKRIHHALDQWQGYHSARASRTAGESLQYLIKEVTIEAEEQELKEHILDNAITYGLSPEHSRATFKQLEMSIHV